MHEAQSYSLVHYSKLISSQNVIRKTTIMSTKPKTKEAKKTKTTKKPSKAKKSPVKSTEKGSGDDTRIYQTIDESDNVGKDIDYKGTDAVN